MPLLQRKNATFLMKNSLFDLKYSSEMFLNIKI